MPELGGTITTTRIELPSTKDSDDKGWVELKSKLSLGDYVKIQQLDDEFEMGIAMLESLIQDWNLTVAGKKAEINRENLLKFDEVDFLALSDWVKDNIKAGDSAIDDDEKKSSISTSAESLTSSDQAQPESPVTTIPIS